MKFLSGDKMLLLGWFREGKTTCLADVASAAPKALVFDPTDKLNEFVGWTKTSLADAHKAVAKHTHVAVVEEDADEAVLDAFAEFAFQLDGWAVGVDELGVVIPKAQSRIPPNLSKLWRYGHKKGISVLIANHLVSETPSIFRGVEHLMQMRIDIHSEKEYWAKQWGPEWYDKLTNMKRHWRVYKAAGEPPKVLPPCTEPSKKPGVT